MSNNPTSPQEWLASELEERRRIDSTFSLRKLARALGLSPGRLSEYLSGKREITLKQGEKLFERLEYSAEQRDQLRKLFHSGSATAPYARLAEDTFRVIAEGAHLALLCLMDTPNFKTDETWLAARLRIDKSRVRETVDRLVRVGLIEIDGDRWKKTDRNLATGTDVPSAALKASHKESLAQAIAAIDEIVVELRDITSITMALDPAKLPAAKKQIQAFRRKMCAFLEDGEQKQVYNLNIQLVPVTASEDKCVI